VEHRFNNRRFIDRHRQGLTHFNVVQRRFLRIKRQETGVQPALLIRLMFLFSFIRGKSAGLGTASPGIHSFPVWHSAPRHPGDAKNQTIDFRFPLPVVRERGKRMRESF
jgi:hypothetical protein